MKAARLAGLCCLAAGLVAASMWSVRLGWADHLFGKQTLEATARAAAWTPDHSAYWVRLALLAQEGDPERSERAFQKATEVNPRDARAWIELGLREESEGAIGAAERSLLAAASVDRQYLPKWSLANFYFRRQDTEAFWHWAREAARVSYRDPSPLFRLCWMVSEDGDEVARRLELEDPDLRASYVAFLLRQDRVSSLPGAATSLLEAGRREDQALLFGVCERLLSARQLGAAIEVWNAVNRRLSTGYQPLAPAAGVSLTNPRFEIAPISRGFDWRLTPVRGVSVSRLEEPGGLRVAFSGRQPEQCEPVWQWVPVLGGRTYTVEFDYRTTGIAAASGLAVRVLDGTGPALLGDSGALFSDRGARTGFRFRTPPGDGLVRLALAYRRSPGTTRIEGAIVLSKVDLRPEEGLPGGGRRTEGADDVPVQFH